MDTNLFENRHIASNCEEQKKMLSAIKVETIEQLISETVPKNIRLKNKLELEPALSEYEYLSHIKELSKKNKVFKSYIGLGYNEAILPSVIQRNILENPSWYTAYTPYQAEISQGRLEALLNFQTMICDLTDMELANASLLDESTAAAEAMTFLFNLKEKNKKKENVNKFFVSSEVFPQTLSVLETRANSIDIKLVVGNHEKFDFSDDFFGAIIQYPGKFGQIFDYSSFVDKAHSNNIKVAVAADILSLVKLKPPGEFQADVVVGSTQRFGIPLGYGGPHAAYFATKKIYKRNVPGRIIGVTKDKNENLALRMALQTREQHIKREKATSNICTAQVLLAVMAGMYAVYHGKNGLQNIADRVHNYTKKLSNILQSLGFKQLNTSYFDTILIEVETLKLQPIAIANKINFNYINQNLISISLNETVGEKELDAIISCFEKAFNVKVKDSIEIDNPLSYNLLRKTSFLENETFITYHSETSMMRYIKKLERRDFTLSHSMIPLGSCTMKLNAASEMLPLSDSQWGNIHPYVPLNQAKGYHEVLKKLEHQLNIITGFKGTSLQPNSGSQGEFAGLIIIKSYHNSRGDSQKNVCLIPSSAHGTNFASAKMAGMKIIVIKTEKNGNIDIKDLKEKAELHRENLSALIITYPSTNGIFENEIKEITTIVHQNGGQVYMDGANMNAQVGITNPVEIGADVCHLNLHKTFAIPHGGGGPGVGPICVAPQLAPFLPTNPVVKTGGKNAITAISAAPWGSALVCLVSYGYIKMLGAEGLTNSTKNAILNANYIKEKLGKHYKILYTGHKGRVAHELIIDCREFKQKGIQVIDIAKRLMDYGFHAPTISFPVEGTMMIEPTESENLSEINRFCEAMISIRNEIDQTNEENKNNILKNAPHTEAVLTADDWNFHYTRKQAAFPLEYLVDNKFWPSVSRVDDAFGDRNLICSCNYDI